MDPLLAYEERALRWLHNSFHGQDAALENQRYEVMRAVAFRKLGCNGFVPSFELLQQLLSRFTDVTALQTVTCLLEAVFSQSSVARLWLPNLELVETSEDEDDMENYVARFKYEQQVVLYLKTTKILYNRTIVREAFVGKILNELRAQIPNFAYILAAFECSPSIVITDSQGLKTLVGWCTDSPLKSEYVIYEAIPGQTMEDFVQQGVHENDFYEILLQLMLALRLAYLRYRFYHGDFHSQNIIIRPVPQMTILYPTVNGYSNLKTDKVATIIDYGRPVITYQGVEYADSDFLLEDNELYTQRDRIYPLRDIHFLLESLSTHVKNCPQFIKDLIPIVERLYDMNDFDQLLSAVAGRVPNFQLAVYQVSNTTPVALMNLVDLTIKYQAAVERAGQTTDVIALTDIFVLLHDYATLAKGLGGTALLEHYESLRPQIQEHLKRILTYLQTDEDAYQQEGKLYNAYHLLSMDV